ncbi:sporulation membrane protein YtaF [Brevibacillus daliensis]|uniref:sporulation membrane protein YtaF n=1 Tax=Brevibacillus daliensis TaxID=2892995 RepID=UPI001E3DBB97|nr:sporulation membrane protein YtaF [Brevibacillus daliensis]
MSWIPLLLVSLAISLDGFGVGLSYGLRRMKLPFFSFLVIGGCSFLVIFFSMSIGSWLQAWVPPNYSSKIGAAVLIIIGGLTIWKMVGQRKEQFELNKGVDKQGSGKKEAFQWTIHLFGLIIHILRDPQRADADKSGHIVGLEAVVLGLALSLDAFGSGISLTLLGFNPLLTSCAVALASILTLWVGITLGSRFASVGWIQRLSYLPPLLLIGIGLFKMGK